MDSKTKETLRIDMSRESANQFKNADILIFNTGHWWTNEKTSSRKDYYQKGSHAYSDLNVVVAFQRAITAWARWLDANVNPSKTHVLFLGFADELENILTKKFLRFLSMRGENLCRGIENSGLTPSFSLRTSFNSVFEDVMVDATDEAYEEMGMEDYMGCASVHRVGPTGALFDTIRDG